MKMFLDDLRNPPDDTWIVVRSYAEAVAWMKENFCPELISFDHDLGEAESGFDLAKWIVETDLDTNRSFIPEGFQFKIHSANPIGRENINGLLQQYLAFEQ